MANDFCRKWYCSGVSAGRAVFWQRTLPKAYSHTYRSPYENGMRTNM